MSNPYRSHGLYLGFDVYKAMAAMLCTNQHNVCTRWGLPWHLVMAWLSSDTLKPQHLQTNMCTMHHNPGVYKARFIITILFDRLKKRSCGIFQTKYACDRAIAIWGAFRYKCAVWSAYQFLLYHRLVFIMRLLYLENGIHIETGPVYLCQDALGPWFSTIFCSGFI